MFWADLTLLIVEYKLIDDQLMVRNDGAEFRTNHLHCYV